MAILRLLASLGLDKTGWDAGLAKANKEVEQFGSHLKGHLAAAFSAGAVIAFTESIIKTGAEIKLLSQRLGVGTDDVQEFRLAAMLGGRDSEIFAKALEKVRIAMVKATSGGGNPLSVFGVSLEQMKSGDGIGLLRGLSVALKDFSGSAVQTKALTDVFGVKQAGAVVNMLRELEHAKEAAKFSDADVTQLHEVENAYHKLWNTIKVGAFQLFKFGTPMGLYRTLKNALHPTKGAPGIPEGLEDTGQADIAAKAWAATQDRINKLNKEGADIEEKTRVSQLTREEHLNELLKEREKILDRLFTAEFEDPISAEKRAEMGKRLAEVNAGIVEAGKLTTGGFKPPSSGDAGIWGGAVAAASVPQKLDAMTMILKRVHEDLFARGIVISDVK